MGFRNYTIKIPLEYYDSIKDKTYYELYCILNPKITLDKAKELDQDIDDPLWVSISGLFEAYREHEEFIGRFRGNYRKNKKFYLDFFTNKETQKRFIEDDEEEIFVLDEDIKTNILGIPYIVVYFGW